jgi:GntR family transcriptional regulator of arabinose operon
MKYDFGKLALKENFMSDIPKYMALVSWIKNKIEANEFQFGDKIYSENELSAMFGISRQTVRQAINVLVQEKYIQSRRGSGTYIIYNGVTKRQPNMIIGVVTTYVGVYIFPHIIRGIETVLTENDYSMQLAFTHNKVQNETRVLRSMLEKGVDGIIIEPTQSGLPNPNMELYREILSRHIPVLFINSYYPNLKIPHVALDDRIAGFTATDYLIQAGHRRIAGIFKSDDNQGHLRYEGYMQALLKAGCEIHDENVLWYSTEDLTDHSLDSRRVLRRIRDCTGLVCYNDEAALEVVDLLKMNRISVPDDISLVSIDNSDLASLCEVPLTSVAHPMEQLGETAARNMVGLIHDRQFKATVEFQPGIVERNSVKKIQSD